MSQTWVIVLATVAIIALSAFFVAVEFALIAAKRHRLEDAAGSSRAARAALRSANELTLLLAGSQLGITVCTLALGAITKPAVHHWLTPIFASWGLPLWGADVAGFVLALVLVTFLHLVVGEMAPKSWAIAHPERSATLLALPMRGFMWLTRPVLRSLNSMANSVLVRIGVEPSDQVATGQSPAALLHLVEHSANVGALDARYSTQLTSALELETLTVGELLGPGTRPTAVPATSTARDVQEATLASGHLRILVGDARNAEGVVHVRDTLAVEPDRLTASLMRPVFRLAADTRVYTALKQMRQTGTQLAVVVDGEDVTGVVTLTDMLRRLFPEADTVATT
ncbi:hemolysin family protein [Intrasporangium sp.]|uniref:hemolysin family protein n=1 Tax=Intrasporangium sp. TaxID=1925024 RepID=UPI002939BD31|nr:hemolysin family protein [Intrasporangium sp.]MDV3220440.1 hemolysin family protein [Intrasporangium sp.]